MLLFLLIQSIKAQDYNLYFDFNSAELRINDVGKLHQLYKQFNPDIHQIHLIGHTDTVGNYTYNLELSKRRTESAKSYLQQLGISTPHISTDYKGKNKPVASDQFYNRRVELFLTTRIEDTPVSVIDVSVPHRILKDSQQVVLGTREPRLVVVPSEPTTFEAFTSSLKPTPQEFTVPSNQPIELEGNRGTIINIPENAFVKQSGDPITGEITVKLTEYYGIEEYYSENLPTVSGGNLLTSAGVANIQVFQRAEQLKLKQETDIQLSFPKTNELPYYTFYGDRQQDGRMNWVSDKRQLESNQRDYGDVAVTVGEVGVSLVITDTATARKRNSNLYYNPITKEITELSGDKLQKAKRVQKKIDENREKYYNQLKANQLEYINCDDFVRSETLTAVNYILELETPDVLLVSAILIFRKANGFLDFSIYEGKYAQLNNRMPLTSTPELLVIGMKGNQPYYYFNKVRISSKKREKISLEKTTFKEIKNKLKG